MLLDAGRTKLLADPDQRESLQCIRCGACLNACPVYRKIGGHNYPGVYTGPIGKVITPALQGKENDSWLPFASSLCGACGEVCPVKIDIPGLLIKLRKELVRADPADRSAFRVWAWLMRRPTMYGLAGRIGRMLLRRTLLRRMLLGFNFGPLAAWRSERDFPVAPSKSFRACWKERKK